MADILENTGAPEAGAPNIKANFGVHIPELGKIYTKDELQNDQDALEYLADIKSAAVTVIKEEPI